MRSTGLREFDDALRRVERSAHARREVCESAIAATFKYRNKTGLDVAIEELRDYRRARGSLDAPWRMADLCRGARVIRP